jgi:hypothetical protein
VRFKRQESRHPTRAAIERLSAELGLAQISQDWELEAADPNRVFEFLNYYDTQQLNDDERFTLMSLIVASFDEVLSGETMMQDQIVVRLNTRFDLLNSLIQYWAMPDCAETESGFNFTPIAREVMRSNYGDREHWPRTPFSIMGVQTLLNDQGVYDCLEISDNRDGTFELFWSKIAGRDSGAREFSTIEEAMKFADCQFGIDVGAWQTIK